MKKRKTLIRICAHLKMWLALPYPRLCVLGFVHAKCIYFPQTLLVLPCLTSVKMGSGYEKVTWLSFVGLVC